MLDQLTCGKKDFVKQFPWLRKTPKAFLSYGDLKNEVNNLEIKSIKDYNNYRIKNKKVNWHSRPNDYYCEWTNWLDFFDKKALSSLLIANPCFDALNKAPTKLEHILDDDDLLEKILEVLDDHEGSGGLCLSANQIKSRLKGNYSLNQVFRCMKKHGLNP